MSAHNLRTQFWICDECAKGAGAKMGFREVWYDVGECGICKETKCITRSRDWVGLYNQHELCREKK